jgi:chaperonin cofactor prefoldin
MFLMKLADTVDRMTVRMEALEKQEGRRRERGHLGEEAIRVGGRAEEASLTAVAAVSQLRERIDRIERRMKERERAPSEVQLREMRRLQERTRSHLWNLERRSSGMMM